MDAAFLAGARLGRQIDDHLAQLLRGRDPLREW
jgi:hypothetical protein